jgi:electron transfer flavoprotein alpha subunit
MATTLPGAFPAVLPSSPPDGDAGCPAPEIVRMRFDLPDAGLVRLLSRVPVEEAGRDLAGARVVVAGGKGVGSKEGFLPLERLAGLLGGAVGASRSAVEAGFAPYSRQVGQTGRTVRPELYIAFGISGSVQHLAGMSGSARLIAVNADPAAPIFDRADLGIVGDAVKTAEAMLRILEAGTR